ncbi:MAG: hypothetical protein ABIG95_06760 [Candidatus Woesearchaeota archaeon]
MSSRYCCNSAKACQDVSGVDWYCDGTSCTPYDYSESPYYWTDCSGEHTYTCLNGLCVPEFTASTALLSILGISLLALMLQRKMKTN